MSSSKTGSIIAGISLGLVIGFATGTFLNSKWKLIPYDMSKTPQVYNNVNYPAFLLNESTGKVILIGDISFDTNEDGETDEWKPFMRVLYEGY